MAEEARQKVLETVEKLALLKGAIAVLLWKSRGLTGQEHDVMIAFQYKNVPSCWVEHRYIEKTRSENDDECIISVSKETSTGFRAGDGLCRGGKR